ncbi:TIGR02302 family protein [Albimonas sp. CAU 1670]|uniref:TIGR02302 family protein n=1 Tax=Albimonas sp. CAU 1670 TaxID=3032599 RepID=UPI0023DCD847|nr:TIGR02302 family protein [Albimonas sp. CAU 1670]MDF2234539.1 TIGR02302 family protein [Albimonas sp. CAU 1670]
MTRPTEDPRTGLDRGDAAGPDRGDAAGAERPAPDPVQARIARETRRSLRALWLERIVQSVWPAYAVVAAFLGLALAGAFEAMPRWAHLGALIVFGLGFVATVVWGVRSFRRPTAAEARASLEVDHADRPLAALADRQATGISDSGARAVWAAHQRRMAEQAGLLKARAAELRLSSRDPMAFRLTALGLLLFGLLAAAGGGGDRVVSAFDPGAAPSGAVEIRPSVEAWATPPAYTGAQMVYLTERAGQTVALPQGSRISLRVYNAAETPALSQDVAGAEVALAPFGERTWDLQLEAVRTGSLSVDPGQGAGVAWSFEIAQDAPPSIAFDDEAGPAVDQAETGALRVAFQAADDHGVTTAWAVIALDREALGATDETPPPPPGLETPIEIELPLPLTGAAETVREALIEDLTEHGWAGLPVTVTLHAEDALGQSAQAGPRKAVLPARPFYDPMARALVEERRAMAWSMGNLAPASQRLKAATAYPDDWFDNLAGPYLMIRSAIRRLDYALADGRQAEEVGSVMDLLWQAALMLEEGDLNSAAERLRRAKERLSDAIERGASPEEISRLMEEMRQAMNELLNEMARQAMENLDQLDQQGEQRGGQQLSNRDLQEMLDEIERMAQEDPAAAQRMLEQLAQMLQNLQMRAQQGGEGQQGEGQQSLDQLNDMLREQQDLADRSFGEMQRRQGQNGQPGQPGEGQQGQRGGQGGQEFGQNGQGEQGVPGMGGDQQGNGMAGAAQEQEALRQLLDQLRRNLPRGLSPEAEEALRGADESMDGAREALEGDDPGEALDDQVQAMENLREGARQLGEAMRQQARNGQGDRAGEGDPNAQDEGRDPLGRPTANRGAMEGSDTEVPGQEALKRARELLDEIRRRAGDRTRPEVELEYLRRLLERF